MAKALHLYDVIVRPVVTEKSNIASSDHHQYTFEVAMKATKIQVKEAVDTALDQ